MCMHFNLLVFGDELRKSFEFLEMFRRETIMRKKRSNSLIRYFFLSNFLYHIYAVALVSTTWIVLTNGFNFVPVQREVVYEYVGSVIVEAQAPWDEIKQNTPLPTGWKVRGTFKLQRIDANTLAAAVSSKVKRKNEIVANVHNTIRIDSIPFV